AGRSPRRTSCPRGAARRSRTACSNRGSARNSRSKRRGSSRRPRSARRWNAIRAAGTAWTSSRSRMAIPWRRTEIATEMGRMPFFYNQEGRTVQVDYALLAGIDHLGVQLIQVDPSGTTFKGSAFAIGQSADDALETIVKGYRPDISVDAAVALVTQAIEGVNGGKSVIEHGIVTAYSKRFEHRQSTVG